MIDMTVGPILEDFASAYTITRAGAINFNTVPGQPTAAASSTVSITAVVQPLSSRDLQRLPEGLRTEQLRKLYTEASLVLEPTPDTISIDGLTWQVEAIEPWDLGIYFKVLLRKVG